ncbi:MAG: FAD binding domain-containing protein, partial [Acidimicrobiales bacterium]
MDDVPILIPRSIADACAALTTNPDATVLAGGTDLMVEINAGHRRPTAVVSLGGLDELASWQELGGDVPPPTLVLGAGLTYTALMSGRLAERLPALAAASRTVGSPQIRNAGTLGGNLGTASPAGDTLPVLAALDATVDLVSSSGERSLPLEEFITGPKRTARRSDELISSVRFPAPDGPQQFLKVGTRNAMVIAAVSLAAIVDRPTRSVRLALGAVGPTTIRARDAEAWLADRLDWETATAPDPTLLAELARRVSESARPIDDHRSTA